jgi:hypothetical protein
MRFSVLAANDAREISAATPLEMNGAAMSSSD